MSKMYGGKMLLRELDKAEAGGLYALAPSIKSGKYQIKVGRTINFRKRLNDYHLCFNEGYYVIALLPLKARTPPKERLKLTMQLEKAAGKKLGKSRTYANRKTRDSEWYYKTTQEIHRLFTELHQEFTSKALTPDEPNDYLITTPPIVKFDQKFINIFTAEGIKTTAYKVVSTNAKKIVIKMNVKKNMRKIPSTIKK
jgi:hypothetical protein